MVITGETLHSYTVTGSSLSSSLRCNVRYFSGTSEWRLEENERRYKKTQYTGKL